MSNQYDTYYGKGMGKMYTGYDTSKTPMDQEYTGDTSSLNTDEEIKTWADFLRVSALNYMQSYTAYADLARKNGLTLNDEEKAEIDERVSSIKKSADNNDFSLDRYIQKIYGKGVTEKVLRAALEDSTLASKYAQQKQSEISDAITNDEIAAEYEANPNNYTTLSVSAFKVSANANVDSNATDEEKTAANTAAMSEAKASADKYAANVKSADDLLKQAQSYNSSLTSSSVVLSDTTYSSISSSLGSAAADWAVSSDRKVGEVGVIEVDGGYVVMYITATAHLDETRAVMYVIFSSSSNQQTAAELPQILPMSKRQSIIIRPRRFTTSILQILQRIILQLLQTATAMTPVQIPKAAFMRMLSPVRWLLSLTTGALIHQENPAIPI